MPDGTDSDHTEWLIRCLPMLRAYVKRLVSDSEMANDILQSVSVTILSSTNAAHDIVEFAAWSRGVMRHVMAAELRARQRSQSVLALGDELSNAPDLRIDPENDAASRAKIARLADDLNPGTMELLFRRYVLGESAKDLASQLAESPAALRMRLMRARSALRAQERSRRGS